MKNNKARRERESLRALNDIEENKKINVFNKERKNRDVFITLSLWFKAAGFYISVYTTKYAKIRRCIKASFVRRFS